MPKRFALTLSGCLALSLWTATLAAPAQDRPGIVSQPRILIDNRGHDQAIPVSVEEWVGAKPLSVQVTGTPSVQLAGTPTIAVRFVSQGWLYRSVRVPAGQDMANVLMAPGNDGWEATGIQTSDASGVTLLLKRPR